EGWAILLRQKQKKLIMLPSETMIWQPEFTDKTLSRKIGAVHSHLSPLGWEHINLNGDYVWRNNLKLGTGKYRPLRSVDIESYNKQS
ncbi:hypothetical protein, partial [Escherichia coli]|uniref:hypothetical protein n=1 Tax=Escherichia coli TaxID=562 RepID=UPI001BCA06A6